MLIILIINIPAVWLPTRLWLEGPALCVGPWQVTILHSTGDTVGKLTDT